MRILINTGSQLVRYTQSVSHMRNLVNLYEILVCENVDGHLVCFYFRRVYFFFAPITPNIFQDIVGRAIARGMVV